MFKFPDRVLMGVGMLENRILRNQVPCGYRTALILRKSTRYKHRFSIHWVRYEGCYKSTMF